MFIFHLSTRSPLLLRRGTALAFRCGTSTGRPLLCRHLASLSMESIKGLRARSGAPIVDCKKALESSGGDLDKAMDWLREHGAAKASSKVQGRETTEGLIGLMISSDGKTGALVKVASETDFASRSSKFVQLVMDVAAAATNSTLLDGEIPTEHMLTVTGQGSEKSVKDMLDEAIVAIRENISVSQATKLQTSDDSSLLVGYVHNRVESSDAGSAAAIVEIAPVSGQGDKDALLMLGKKLAMHIVAARPQYLSPNDVPNVVLDKEKEILAKQLSDSGKAPELIDKIVQGRLRKFYEDVCLTEQAHMIEELNPKVGKVLEDKGVVVKRFVARSIA